MKGGAMRKRFTSRLGAGVLIVLATGATALVGSGQASAITLPLPIPPLFHTTTSVTATPGSQVLNQNDVVTVTATVGPLGLGITPKGSVYFQITAPGARVGINSDTITLSSCVYLFSTCKASLTFPVGVGNYNNDGVVIPGIWTVEAVYSGDSLSKTSIGYTTFKITNPA
jgi:hypothetical protein